MSKYTRKAMTAQAVQETIETFSPFEIAVRLFDYSHLELLLAHLLPEQVL